MKQTEHENFGKCLDSKFNVRVITPNDGYHYFFGYYVHSESFFPIPIKRMCKKQFFTHPLNFIYHFQKPKA